MCSVYILGLVTKHAEVKRVREESLLLGYRNGVLAVADIHQLPVTPGMAVLRDLRHVSLAT